MADRLNAATKYVATHRPESLGWGPFEGIGPDLVDGVRGIKAKDGADLILSGSSTLTSALIEHGLGDEVVLLVNPVLLGEGERFFADGTPPRAFTLAARKLCRRASSSTPTRSAELCGTRNKERLRCVL
jgi:dihydrofolate reductase